MQREILRRGKNLALSEDMCFEKGKDTVKVDHKKSGSRIEVEKRVELEEISLEVGFKGDTPRKRPYICSA